MNILITGASRGIGAALAKKLAASYHRLILVSRNEKSLKSISAECNEIAEQKISDYIVCDLSRLDENNEGFAEQLTDAAIDVLVNNAGMLINKPFEDIQYEEELAVFKANYFGPAALIRICLPNLKISDHPSIINIATMGAVQGSSKFSGLSAYSSSKGALVTLTECLAEELASSNIRVNALAIGAVETEMFKEAFPEFSAGTSPEEMADFIKWFIEDGTKRFNGKILPVSHTTP